MICRPSCWLDPLIRPLNSSWDYFTTISLILTSTFIPMGLTHSAVEDVNTWHQNISGWYVKSVSGEDGVQSSHTWQLSSTWSLGMMIQPCHKRTFSIPIIALLWNAQLVADHVLVLDLIVLVLCMYMVVDCTGFCRNVGIEIYSTNLLTVHLGYLI